MLEKEILRRMIELLPVSDQIVARKMLERSGVRFLFAGGKSGTYSAGMLKLDGTGGVIDFNVGAITGFVLAQEGVITSGLDVDQSELVQDLRNQLVQEEDTYRRELNVLHKELAENEKLLAEGNKLLAYADQRLKELQEAMKEDIISGGEGEDK